MHHHTGRDEIRLVIQTDYDLQYLLSRFTHLQKTKQPKESQ